jgi:DNA-binding CsgD family transcriptional regulator
MVRPLNEYAGTDSDDEYGAYARLLRIELKPLLLHGHLTDRQEVCFCWRLKKILPPEIAASLGIDESTVRQHLEAVLAVLKRKQWVGLKTVVVEEMGYEALGELADVSNWSWFEQYSRRRQAERVAKIRQAKAPSDDRPGAGGNHSRAR